MIGDADADGCDRSSVKAPASAAPQLKNSLRVSFMVLDAIVIASS
jgi:hypothetical protein